MTVLDCTPRSGFLVRMEHHLAIGDRGNENRPQALEDMRPPLAGVDPAHVADSQRSLPATRCS